MIKIKFSILALILCTQSAFAQVRHGTVTEEIIANGIFDRRYVARNDVGLCSLPMVTRGDGESFVDHHLIVETVFDHVTETTERIYLRTDNQFAYDDCKSHKQKILASMFQQGGQIPITLHYTDKLIVNRGSYMGMLFCHREQFRTIEVIINKIRYFKTIKTSEENCN